MDRLRALQTPAIFINVKQEFDAVHPDDLRGGEIATEHLLQLGHTRIAYARAAVNLKEHYSEIDRRLGYEAAMQSAGLPPLIWRSARRSGRTGSSFPGPARGCGGGAAGAAGPPDGHRRL